MLSSLSLLLFFLAATNIAIVVEARKNVSFEIFEQLRSAKEIVALRSRWNQNKFNVSGKFAAKYSKFIDNRFPHSYVATYIRLGTPIQKFVAAYEIGRPDIWVMDPTSPYLGDDQPAYEADKSSTSKSIGGVFKGRTGEMRVVGQFYSDLFTLQTGYTWTQTFGVVKNVYKDDVDTEIEISAVIGLAWSTGTDYKPPIQNILESLEATHKIYTFFLGPHRKPSEGRSKGQFTPGSVDTANCGADFEYVQVRFVQTYMAFTVQEFAYDKYTITKSQTGAVDTGYPVILFPKTEYDTIYKALNPQLDSDTQLLVVPCSSAGKLADFKFSINGRDYKVSSTQYIVDLELPNGNCALAIGPNYDIDVQPKWILGTPFIREHCVVVDWDKKRIGFSAPNDE